MNANLKDELDLIDSKSSPNKPLKRILFFVGIITLILYLSIPLSFSNEKEFLSSEIDNLNDELISISQEYDNLINENVSLLETIDQLKEKTKSTESKMIVLNKEITSLDKEIAKLSNALDNKDILIARLNQEENQKSNLIIESETQNPLEFVQDRFDDLKDPPPPSPSGPQVKFIPYDDAPVPITPIRPVYPDLAQEAGVEGQVIVQCFIDDKGRVKETIILKGIPNTGLNESAVEALRKTRFRPAKQRNRAVGVWITIPINFTLN
jgi:TonB family protein